MSSLSYLRCWGGLVYFSFVTDVYIRMIVGWQLATHMRTDLVFDVLKMAFVLRGPGADVELVHHSDRGFAARIHRSRTLPREQSPGDPRCSPGAEEQRSRRGSDPNALR
jgi:transposase InsO family protein